MGTALLVIDMQNFFAGVTRSALPNVLRLTTHFHEKHLPTNFTQHGHTKAELTPPFTNQLVKKWGPSGSIAVGSKDWELMPEIEKAAEQSNEPAVHVLQGKNSYDAFINTDLDTRLKENGVHRVVICGVLTDCCCETTARSAFNRGYETWLVHDACGDSLSHKAQKMAFEVFERYYDSVVSTEEVLARLG